MYPEETHGSGRKLPYVTVEEAMLDLPSLKSGEGTFESNYNKKENSLYQIWHGKNFNNLRILMKGFKRLMTKPCLTCSDGGVTEEEGVSVGSRTIKAVRYTYQNIDVKELIK